MTTASSPRLCLDCKKPLGSRKTALRCRSCANAAKAGNPTQREAARRFQSGRHLQQKLWRDRFDELVRQEVERLALSPDELSVVRHVVRGATWDATAAPFLASEVEEAIRGEGLRRWPFDADALVSRLRALSPLQSLAVIATLERGSE